MVVGELLKEIRVPILIPILGGGVNPFEKYAR